MDFSILLKKNSWLLIVNRSLLKLKFGEVMMANSYEDYKDLIEQLRLYRMRRNNSCYIKIFNTETNTSIILQRNEIQNLCLLMLDFDNEMKLIKDNTHAQQQLKLLKFTTFSFEKQLFKN